MNILIKHYDNILYNIYFTTLKILISCEEKIKNLSRVSYVIKFWNHYILNYKNIFYRN